MATKAKNPDFSKYIRRFWLLFAAAIGFVMLIFLLASFGVFGTMPTFEELENPDSNIATEIITTDGVTIGKFYNENRTMVKFEELPQHLVDAVIATEDERFYDHSGIDGKRSITAALALGSRGGASTISQQLAKLLFHEEGSRNIVMRILQKSKEWIIAVRLERQYTKNEIIAMYFNKFDFINGAVGIRSASRIYYGKEPKDLTLDEAAVLVGMLKNPSLYNPKSRVENATNRRNTVLSQMVKNGYLSKEDKEIFSQKPIKLDFRPETHHQGVATYFREYLRDFMKQWTKDNKKADGSDYNIYRDGLKIYVTLDSRMQQYAEEAVTKHMANLQQEFDLQKKGNPNYPFVRINEKETERIINQAMKNSERWRQMSAQGKSESEIRASFKVPAKMKVFSWKGERDTTMTPLDSIRYYKAFLQTGMMAMEPATGHIKAWVGGIDYKYFQYDHVGQGARQVGSTFKPFVYASAIEQLNFSPCDSILDAQFTIPKGRHNVTEDWSPKNSDHQFRGMVTLKRALASSINTVSAKLIDKVGPEAVVDLSKKLGITSNIPAQPSIALGAAEVTVMEMVAAYSTFANQGIYIKPQFITRIEDKNGSLIYQPTPESHDVLNRDIAFAVVKLLEGVTESGSGARLRTQGGGHGYNRVTGYPYVLNNPIAGKTGTSQNQSDGWFVGMVPNLAAGVWVGCEDRSARFKSITYGQGATAALPIWGMFMKSCYNDKELEVSKEAFPRPANLAIKVDCWKPAETDSTAVDSEQDTDEFGF